MYKNCVCSLFYYYITCTISVFGNLALNLRVTSLPSGAPPHASIRSDPRSYLFAKSDFTSATTSGGDTGMYVALYFSTALSIVSKSNLSTMTIVSACATDLTAIMNPNTWKSGSVKNDTGSGSFGSGSGSPK